MILGLINEEEPWQINMFTDSIAKLENRFLQDKLKADMVFVNTDSAAETVLNKSQHLAIDLIVITANLDNENRSLFMESYAQQIVNKAKVPVLALNSQVVVLPASTNFTGIAQEHLEANL